MRNHRHREDPVDPSGEGPDRYPPYVDSAADRRRWDLCQRLAEELVGGPDADPATTWFMVRRLYQSDLET